MPSYSLFIDFDFTITTDDVGNRLFTYFSQGRAEPIVQRWLRREISSYTCLTEEARLCRGTKDEFARYVDKFEIDPGFGTLVGLCRQRGIPLYILSDGLDFYINRILGKYGFGDITFFSNRAEFAGTTLQISLPYWTEKCPQCGNCKGERIKTLKRDDDRVIYIGDGFSDLCAIKQADLILAKDDLAEYLRRESLDFIEYNDLSDTAEILKNLIMS